MSGKAPETVRIEVFRPGTFTPMEGRSFTYSAADLRAAADAYDKATGPAPVVVGHPSTDAPAYGWAEKFEFDPVWQRLFADVGEINPAFAEAVRSGTYKKVSMSFHHPEGPANPVPGTWYPKHIGFLGGAAPAVAGLRNVQFGSEKGIVTFTADFSGAAFPPAPLPVDPAFAAREAAFAAREAEFATKEAEWKKREQEFNRKDNVAFTERLVDEGRLLPIHQGRIVSMLDAAAVSAPVSFAEGQQAVPMLQALRDFLSEQPKVVSFGAFDTGPDPIDGRPPSLTVPAGYTVSPGQNELYQRARQIEREKGVSFAEAVDLASGR